MPASSSIRVGSSLSALLDPMGTRSGDAKFHSSATSKSVSGRQSLSMRAKWMWGYRATIPASTKVPAHVGCTLASPVASQIQMDTTSVRSLKGPTSWTRLAHQAAAGGQCGTLSCAFRRSLRSRLSTRM